MQTKVVQHVPRINITNSTYDSILFIDAVINYCPQKTIHMSRQGRTFSGHGRHRVQCEPNTYYFFENLVLLFTKMQKDVQIFLVFNRDVYILYTYCIYLLKPYLIKDIEIYFHPGLQRIYPNISQ